jgi:hypothetical protein
MHDHEHDATLVAASMHANCNVLMDEEGLRMSMDGTCRLYEVRIVSCSLRGDQNFGTLVTD